LLKQNKLGALYGDIFVMEPMRIKSTHIHSYKSRVENFVLLIKLKWNILQKEIPLRE